MSENAESFGVLFRGLYNDVLRFMERRVADREDAAELAADVFRVAWQKYDPQQETSRSWLFAVARNTILDYYRRTGRRDAATQRLIAQTATDQGGRDPAEGDDHPVTEALALLPEHMQEILRLRYWEGLDIGEIATVLGITTPTARVRLHRARSRVRELLPAYLNHKEDA
ncbi:MAG: sigma-70 family RNA polymerase sigma factor [Microbacterium sp.]